MKLKRIFNRDEAGNPTTVSHLRVLQEPQNGQWNVGQRTIDKGIAEGWLSIGGGKLTIKTAEGEPDVVYQIVQPPGHYCVYCGEAVGSTKRGLKHVAEKHAGEKLATLTPEGKLPENCTQHMLDQINNPSGVAKFNHFVTRRVS
jgi:hypothetical protein